MYQKHFEQRSNQWNQARPEMNYDPNYQQANRVRLELMGFMAHLTSYLMVNALLVGIYVLTTFGGYPWFIWPIFGWGIGLAAHGLAVAKIFFRSTGASYHSLVEQQMYRSGYEPRPYQYPATSQPTASWPETNSDQSRY